MNNANYLTTSKYIALTLLYLLANGIIIFNNGIFWDDWCLYNMSFEGIMTQFKGNGALWYGYLHYYFNQTTNPTLLYNSLTIILQLFTAFALLKTIVLLKLNQKVFFIVVLLATISPFFMAKNTMICFPYTLSYFMFFVGFYLLILAVKKSNIFLRIIALFLFFLSFIVNSFILYYCLPFVIVYLLYSKINISKLKKENFYKLNFKSLLKMSDLIALPFLFLLFKNIYLTPKGLYKDSYNKITASNIIDSPKTIIESIFKQIGQFFELINQSVLVDFEHFFIFTILFFITFIVFKKSKISYDSFLFKKITFSIGIILIVLAIMPYVFVQKPPSFLGYDTRHQLLMPLGFSLVLTSLIFSFIKNKDYNLIFVLIITVNLAITFNMNLQFIKGGFKQQSLVLNFRNNEIIKTNSTLIFYDTTPELDATKNEFRFYSLNGISKLAFDTQTKLICDYKSFRKNSEKNNWKEIMKEAEKFNFSAYQLSNIDAFIKVTKGNYNLSIYNTFKLMFLSLIDKDKAWSVKQNIININAIEANNITTTFFID